MPTLLRLAQGFAWLAAASVIAVGVAGVATAANPVPDEVVRPELYARAQAAITPGLAAITTDLDMLQARV